MNSLVGAAQNLAERLADSECCRVYYAAWEELQAYPALLQKLDVYKKKHGAYRLAVTQGEPPSLNTEAELSNLYWELMLDERVQRFLESERESVALAAELCGVIAAACPADPMFPNL